MEATVRSPGVAGAIARGVAWFLLIPLLAVAAGAGIAYSQYDAYQQAHADRIYTGVMVGSLDLSGLTRDEAAALVAQETPLLPNVNVTLYEPSSGREWTLTAADLGVRYDYGPLVDAAYAVGRTGDQTAQLQAQAAAWLRGHTVAPRIVIDENALDVALDAIAAEIEQPPLDPSLAVDGQSVETVDGQLGLTLDRADAWAKLNTAVNSFTPARIELVVHTRAPRVVAAEEAAKLVDQIIASPMTLYFEEPIEGVDLQNITLPLDRLVEWVRVQLVPTETGQERYAVTLDETAAAAWLEQLSPTIYREPSRARYYFDDPTGELVLIEPHVDGRRLDVAATLERILAAAPTPNRAVPLAIEKIVPVANSNATAEELGITELLSEATTWFAGSSEERMANIARAASKFYGIVIGPGETFSFNEYLGEISAEQGYERGLIIVGGRTIEGIGGGVCQVSTTLFQAAFLSGLDIGSGERWAHGYRVAYYESGMGAGVDATIFSPEIDMTFVNDTPHHLLIENYYNEGDQSLTFKLYSTSIGRTVEWTRSIENETPPNPDVWEYNPDLDAGEVEQVDWAVPGALVTVDWTVYNYLGEVRHQRQFVSNYIPWSNVYQYGPGVDPP